MHPRVLVISIEGISTWLVGPYGTNTAQTPHLNALAARGIVLDQCFLDSCSNREMLRSLWIGKHALSAKDPVAESLWHLACKAGMKTLFITDCSMSASLGEQMGCEQSVVLEPPEVQEPAQDPSACWFMSLLAESARWIEESQQPSHPTGCLVWIHSRGLRLPWDAPIALRREFTDPDDPEPPAEVAIPNQAVTEGTDPDWLVGWGQVAAAQMAVIDQAIGLLLACLDGGAEPWATCIMGLGGVPLGEHGWLGWGETLFHSEQLQVPVILAPSSPIPAGVRRSELCQLPDLGATLADLCGVRWSDPIWGTSLLRLDHEEMPCRWPPAHQTLGLWDGPTKWIRVPAWSLIFREGGEELLYVKPDDRWEVSEVSDRCQEIVALLRELAELFFGAVRDGDRSRLPPLEDRLCNIQR